MERYIILLDDEVTLMTRLCAVEDGQYFREKAYLNLVQQAGQPKNPGGLVTLLLVVFSDMTDGMTGIALELAQDTIDQYFDRFVEAMAGDNPEFVVAAKKFYQVIVLKRNQ